MNKQFHLASISLSDYEKASKEINSRFHKIYKYMMRVRLMTRKWGTLDRHKNIEKKFIVNCIFINKKNLFNCFNHFSFKKIESNPK